MEIHHSFLISVLDGDQWLPSSLDRFTPEEEFPVPIEYETGRDTELVWTFGEETCAACARNGSTILRSSSLLSIQFTG